MKSKKLITIFVITLALILSAVFTVYSFLGEIKRPKLPYFYHIQPFSLINAEGEEFGYAHLKNRVWIGNFFFTTCGDVCPIMNKHMAQLYQSFKLSKAVRLVSFSVNPEYDTPEVLKEYAKQYDVNPNSWIFLTGDREDIKELAVKSFKLGHMDEPIFHSTYLSLVDRQGFVRGVYDGMDQEKINELFKDAAQLLKAR